MKALLLAGIVLLAGCTIFGAKNLDLSLEARLFQAQGEFNILLEAANSYAQRPRCDATLIIGCSDTQIVAEILRLAERINATLTIAREAETPTLGAIKAATAELNTLLIKALAVKSGVPS